MNNILYTIGHSTRSFDDFTQMLSRRDITDLVDVRSFPGSRKNPQFNQEYLNVHLPRNDIAYHHMPSLGGKRRNIPVSGLNDYWEHPSFLSYADYTLSDEFNDGIECLKSLVHEKTCAIMCAEAVWWKCHRRIITDHMLHAGYKVIHIMNMYTNNDAIINNHCVACDGKLVYPHNPLKLLFD